MRRLIRYGTWLVLAAGLWSCAAARYAIGPTDAQIESLPAEGIVQAVTCPSSEKDIESRRLLVYLPPSYAQDSLRRYPVLYLLHGARGNELTWVERGDILGKIDSLRRDGAICDFILVLPNMNNYFGQKDYRQGRAVAATRAFWTVDGEVERHFMTDVVANVDSLFRTQADKSGRAIAGMSSGALQALYLAAGHPDAFGCIGLFSAYAHNTVASVGHRDVYSKIWDKLERQFADPPKEFCIYIGRKDIFYPHMKHFDARMTRKGYAHRFIVTEGGHRWENWSVYAPDFIRQIFPSSTLAP